jgi:shikimate dehydrogenase
MIELGLIGYPLEHSFSPVIHRAAFNQCGLEGKYTLFPINPTAPGEVNDLFGKIRSKAITGLNVTIPYKQMVVGLLDELTLRAEKIGAVNTIYLKNNILIGDNTDAPGFLSHLYTFLGMETEDMKRIKKALILGAGGAARGVVYALVRDGWDVTVAARRIEQAQALINQFPDRNSKLSAIRHNSATLQDLPKDMRLVINATPVGMSPAIDKSPWPQELQHPTHAAYYDLVYNPRETKFVFDARAAGLRATTGMGMLVEQAALAFEIWTGYNVPRAPLLSAVEEK